MVTYLALLYSLLFCLIVSLCPATVLAETHLKTPQNDCSANHLKHHPKHVLPCYLQEPDDNYQWKTLSSLKQPITVAGKKQSIKIHSIEMTSQQWPLDKNRNVNHPLWQHRITIYQPEKVIHDTALLYINGGILYSETNESISADKSPNDDLDFAYIAAISNSIVIDLKDVPNQYLQFNNTKPLKEDALVAYTWEEYLKDPDKNYFLPLRLPMVKATQRAMDTVQTFMRDQKMKINHYVLAGLSKRGWAVWLTAAMDDRVTAIVPMVIDVLNLQTGMDHHYKSYDQWAPAVKDYKNILPKLHSKGVSQLMQIVDPINYQHLLKLPKYIVTASNDDFFVPDASQHYLDDLKGDKWIRTFPNIRHYIARMDKTLVTETLASFYGATIEQRPLPSVYWNAKDEHLKITSSLPPRYIKLWTAINPDTRDFRLTPDNPGVEPFESKEINMKCDSICRVKLSITNKQKGWKASFVELGFSNKPYKDFTITTQVYITPDIYPSDQ